MNQSVYKRTQQTLAEMGLSDKEMYNYHCSTCGHLIRAFRMEGDEVVMGCVNERCEEVGKEEFRW